MKITLNGEDRTLDAAQTVADLLGQLGLDTAPCAVEVNERLVPKQEHGRTTLRDGDSVEIVTLVGGG